ncbi:MFS transporter OS=Streptomyces fumanus OX=67302 GN=GCM10018772_18670 PE=4 SV=1 [Streptomyces fumanus]
MLVTVLNLALSDDQMLSWGWRLPFLIAGPLGVIGLYMRMKLEESPSPSRRWTSTRRASRRSRRAASSCTIVRRHWRPLLVCMGLVPLYNVTNYMVTGYLPTYETQTLGCSSSFADVLGAIGCCGSWC